MKREFFKYNTEDILEILTETLAQEKGFGTFGAHSQLLLDNGKFYFVGVIGELEDMGIDKIDLDELYKTMDYNGTHGDDVWMADEQIKKAFEKIDTGDF